MSAGRGGGESELRGSELAGAWPLGEFLSHCLALEREAQERYAELADQMEVANNPEVAGLFRRLSAIEGAHLEKIECLAEGIETPFVTPWEQRWEGESPEALAQDSAHYLMTPHHALALARAAEERAREFFSEVADVAEDREVERLANELREEEAEHVRLIEDWLARYPLPEGDWDDDPDPPQIQG